MIRLIQQGNEPFMLYFTSQVLLFYNDVVFQMNPLGVNITVPSRKGHCMFMLIDTDLQRSPPPDICTTPNANVFPVHAASPNPIHYSAWMAQYPEALTIGMPLWSYEELYAAYVALYSLLCMIFTNSCAELRFKAHISGSVDISNLICPERTTNSKMSSVNC